MKHICMQCQRTAQSTNLVCTDIECPLQTQRILGSGQIIGDAKIIQHVHSIKTASFYEAQRGDTRVWLKIAHEGCQNQLQLEAKLLLDVQRARLKKNHPGALKRWLRLDRFDVPIDPYPGFPVLLPAFARGDLDQFAYGQGVVDGTSVTFCVWEAVEGIPLREYLTAVPQPWFFNVAYVVLRLALMLDYMHVAYRVVHGKLSPEEVWVREDARGYLRPLLLDFGIISDITKPIPRDTLIWLHQHANLAYLPPEILVEDWDQIEYFQADLQQLDSYGLALLLYEMLAGHPKFSGTGHSNMQLIQAVKQQRGLPLIREDLDRLRKGHFQPLVNLAREATQPSKDRTPGKPSAIADRLQAIVRAIPSERPNLSPAQVVWRASLALGVTMGILLLLSVALLPTVPQ